MTAASGEAVDRDASLAAKCEEHRAAGVACGAHALHDGYTDLITDLIVVMLPVWRAEFGLGYAELGLLRGLYTGTMATFQVTAALLAGRPGAPAVLAKAPPLAGLGYCIAGASVSFPLLLVALFVGGSAPARSIRSPSRLSRAPLPARAR